jgi:hypothetical protein
VIIFDIYYKDREYALFMGDPCLGQIEAASKRDAEEEASRMGWGGIAGVWAVPAESIEQKPSGAEG